MHRAGGYLNRERSSPSLRDSDTSPLTSIEKDMDVNVCGDHVPKETMSGFAAAKTETVDN